METIDPSRILFLNDACVGVNKLPGEAAEGARPGMGDLPKLLGEHLGGPVTAAHRIDVPASGCVLFARTPGALAFLNAAFARGAVEKRYWAVVELPLPPGLGETGELIHWIETDRRRNKSAAYGEEKPGRKRALLRYRILGQGSHYSFWEIELRTGRQHQIRAQLAAAGLHIRGDLKYGARRSEKEGGIRLHARFLAFPNPLDPGETIRLTAPPPRPDNLWGVFRGIGSGE